MIIEERIKKFEKMGIGMFIHFGAYSVLGMGEWVKKIRDIPWDEYMEAVNRFCPKPDWAKGVVAVAKSAGAKYITLTTRHHDGFSLFDTCGLNDYDAPHVCGRDIVKEFVDACREGGVKPFFYHTLLDWHEESYNKDFKEYLKYLRASVELLCKNYGEIGGLWFDGMWDKSGEDWEEDALYSLIRSYQPEAMIINNTGLSARGALGNIQLDSVTFERGRPSPINKPDAPKYIASEMCQVFASHWGYAELDFNFKSMGEIIKDLVTCRRYGSNYLINIGPMADGSVREYDRIMLETLGKWLSIYDGVASALPAGIEAENRNDTFVLEDGDKRFLVVDHVNRASNSNEAINELGDNTVILKYDRPVSSVRWMDNGEEMSFTQGEDMSLKVILTPFKYGVSMVSRVAVIE